MGLQANSVPSSAIVWMGLRNIKYQLKKRKAIIQYQLAQYMPQLATDWSLYNSAVGPTLEMFGRQTMQLTANPSQSDYQGDGSFNSYVIAKDPGLLVAGYNILVSKGITFSESYPLQITLEMASDNMREYQRRLEYWNSVIAAFASIKSIEQTIGVVYTAGLSLWFTHKNYDKSPGQIFVLSGESAGEFDPVMMGAGTVDSGGLFADFHWLSVKAYKDAELPGQSLKDLLLNDGEDAFTVGEKQVSGTSSAIEEGGVDTVPINLSSGQVALTVNKVALGTSGTKFTGIYQDLKQASNQSAFSQDTIYFRHDSVRNYLFSDGDFVDYEFNVVYGEEI